MENVEVWVKAYLPNTRTTEERGNYEDKVFFRHVQIRLVASNEPLIDCGPLPDWLRKKRCIYDVDNFDDNMCVWRCLAIYKRQDIKRGTEFVPKATLDLVREYYGDNKLKQKDVRSTKLVDFEGIARHCDVNIMFYEPNQDSGKDAGYI